MKAIFEFDMPAGCDTCPFLSRHIFGSKQFGTGEHGNCRAIEQMYRGKREYKSSYIYTNKKKCPFVDRRPKRCPLKIVEVQNG